MGTPTAPPPGTPPPYQPPPYGGPAYYPPAMTVEGLLTKRMVWFVNVIGLLGIFIAFVIDLSRPTDNTVIAFGRLLGFGGALLAILISTAAALGSRRTTDMQNVGLFIWAGFLLFFAASFL